MFLLMSRVSRIGHNFARLFHGRHHRRNRTTEGQTQSSSTTTVAAIGVTNTTINRNGAEQLGALERSRGNTRTRYRNGIHIPRIFTSPQQNQQSNNQQLNLIFALLILLVQLLLQMQGGNRNYASGLGNNYGTPQEGNFSGFTFGGMGSFSQTSLSNMQPGIGGFPTGGILV